MSVCFFFFFSSRRRHTRWTGDWSSDVCSSDLTPLQELEARELGGAIEHAIARLRPEYRTCILLRHVEGHSYEEIARILELPLGTVKTYIHRARNELRGYLEDRRE